MEQDKMRAEFEAWWIDSKHDGEPFFIKHAMWVAWQASRAAVVVELPPTEFFSDGENEWGYKVSAEAYRADATISAIHAAGIRTR